MNSKDYKVETHVKYRTILKNFTKWFMEIVKIIPEFVK
jgi:hypothetical protein